MSLLFTPFTMRGLTLPNRIVIAPMCQYSAVEGCATDWHLIHLGQLALSGAGLLVIEATGVEPQGRISADCVGLYNDDNEAALARVLAVVRRYSRMPIGIQLSHAGRKASTKRPIDPGPVDTRAWPLVGPSAVAFSDDRQVPAELDRAGMDRIVAAFAQATRRAARLGLDLIEIHSAHGYLLSSFLSPLANRRTDAYGGSLDKRMRFPLEVFDAVRAAWPADRPAGVRCNGTDWHASGIQVGAQLPDLREQHHVQHLAQVAHAAGAAGAALEADHGASTVVTWRKRQRRKASSRSVSSPGRSRPAGTGPSALGAR
jgi:2,4-dienoyl-CoA reductase-like NADH-dependent reductase (Old Yellow Enzyme family)